MLGQIEQVFEQINKANKTLILANHDSGDSLAASLALFLFLQATEKTADLICGDCNTQHRFNFLPAWDQIKSQMEARDKFVISLDTRQIKTDQVKYKVEKDHLNFIITAKEGKFSAADVSFSNGPEYDLIITIGYADLDSLGEIYEDHADFFYKTAIINIDHDPANESFGQINTIDLNATSNCEIMFTLLRTQNQKLINEDVATCLLTGMISKTKSFKTNNVTPQTLTTASELITMGADRTKIVDRLYRSRRLGVLNLWGKVLTGLNGALDNKLIWAKLAQADFTETKTDPEDLADVIDELIINIPQAKLIALSCQTADNLTLVILYAPKTLNCLEIAKEFNPQGTKSMVKITLAEPLDQATDKIISTLKNQMKQLLQAE
jgi:nanoRNase/pAp phosphatase (c-di-AMP/oligoRNAs hydrolase)